MATIQGVYVALFGRPADPAGLAFFNTATSNGANLTAIGDLASTAEYQDRFEGMNNTSVVTTIYQSLFGRDPDAAGLTFFVAALQAGTLNINNIAIAILDGAQGDDATIIANKLVAANAFTAEINTVLEIEAYKGPDAIASGVAFLSTITADTATIPTAEDTTAAVAAIEVQGITGNVITGDNATEISLNGVANFQTTVNNDTINEGAYTAAAKIDGGFGTDTLNATIGASVTVAAGKLVSVEKVYVDATAAATFDVTAVDGLKEVWNDASVAALTITGVDKDVTVGITGTAAATIVNYTAADIAGTADAATISLSTATATGLTVAGIEALTLNVAGVSTLSGLNAADAETISVTGAGKLTLSGTFADDSTVDASAHTGQFVLTTGSVDGLTVIGGAANDTFNVSVGAEGVTLTGGAGSDLFNILSLANVSTTSVAADLAADVISITDFSGTADTLAFGNILGTEVTLTNVQAADLAAATTLLAKLTVAGEASDLNVGANSYVEFQFNGNTYIYHDATGDGFTVGDGVIELTGFTGDFTAANFVVA